MYRVSNGQHSSSIAATRPAQHPCLARQADRCMTACANVSSTPNLGVYGNSGNQSTDWRYNTCTCSALCSSDICHVYPVPARYPALARIPCSNKVLSSVFPADRWGSANAGQCRTMRRMHRRQSKHARSLNAECQAPATPPSGPSSRCAALGAAGLQVTLQHAHVLHGTSAHPALWLRHQSKTVRPLLPRICQESGTTRHHREDGLSPTTADSVSDSMPQRHGCYRDHGGRE